MSKTDKTTPMKVLERHHGVVDHDHRTGKCVIAPIGYESHWSHSRKCKHRVETVTYCTSAEPHRDPWGQTCWLTHRNFIWVKILGESVMMLDPDNPYTRIQCKGHQQVTWDHSIPCACDTWPEKPTCYTRLPWYMERKAYQRPRRQRGWGDYEAPRARRLASPKHTRKAIEEGLLDWEAEKDDYLDSLPRDCEFTVGETFLWDDLPEWEQQLLISEGKTPDLVEWLTSFRRTLEHQIVTATAMERHRRDAKNRRRIQRGY